MTVLSKPLGSKRRALLIAIRHVHCKAGSKFGNLPDLVFAHRDAKTVRGHLIGTCCPVTQCSIDLTAISDSRGYQADDIILMMDVKSHPEHLWPTRKKIVCRSALHVDC